ncbi:hypothetical protein D9M68_803860 [compost metagenome]
MKIVKKQRQGMFLLGENSNEAPEHQQEAMLCLLRLQLRDCWLLADDEPQLGDQVGHQPRIRIQRLQQLHAPVRQLRVTLAQQHAHQALEGLHQGRIRDVALVLIELTGGE